MSDKDGDAGEQIAQWLKEAGRRSQPVARRARQSDADEKYNSPASLHTYLEELAGRNLRSHAEVLGFLKETAGSQPLAYHARERWRMAREVSLVVLLAASFLHYYYWEVQLQIVGLSSVRTFAPAEHAQGPGLAARRTI